jgi:hypothetical protein
MAMPSIPMRSLQARILAPFVLLIILVQVGGYLLIDTVGVSAARKSVGAEVAVGVRVFDRFLEQDTQRLVQGAKLLTADYAFRETVATRDRGTIASVLANHGKRIDAALMLLVGLDQSVLADASGGVAAGQRFAFPELLDRARDAQQAAAMIVLNGELYQLVIVPVLAPLPVAWLAVGFRVDDALARDLRSLTRLHVSFLTRTQGNSWRAQASTLSDAERVALARDFAVDRYTDGERKDSARDNDEAIPRPRPVDARRTVVAVLQQP